MVLVEYMYLYQWNKHYPYTHHFLCSKKLLKLKIWRQNFVHILLTSRSLHFPLYLLPHSVSSFILAAPISSPLPVLPSLLLTHQPIFYSPLSLQLYLFIPFTQESQFGVSVKCGRL